MIGTSDGGRSIFLKVSILKKFVPFLIWPVFISFVYYYFKEVADGGDSWKTGDWLINFYAGAVRRGLAGSLLIFVSDFGIPLKWLVFSVQVGFYFFIFFFIQKIYLMRERGFEWLMLLFSPAFIFFPFYDLQGGFRKEIIVFASFLVLAASYAKKNLSAKAISVSFVLYILAAFSHELAALTLPFFAYILLRSFRMGIIDRRPAMISMALFSATALSALLFAMAFHGASLVDQICDSVTSRGFSSEICIGAIDGLRLDMLRYNLLWVRSYMPQYVYVYFPLAILAVLPVFISDWFNKKNAAFLAVCFGFLSPLFVVAIDWGRWIHIYVVFVFILMLAESVWQELKIRKLPILVQLIYLTVWSIPHWYSGKIEYGLVGKVFGL